MKKILFIISVALLVISFYSCIDDPDVTPGIQGAGKPVIEGGVTEKGKTANSITVSAKIIKENGSKIIERGFFYGTSPSPTEENGGTRESDKSAAIGIGEYTLTIDNLANGVDYYILPYAVNDGGLVYGESTPPIGTTHGLGSVKTIAPDIYASKVITGVEIFSAGEGEIKTVGVYLYTKKDSAAIKTVSTDEISSENNIYSFTFGELTPSTTYYILAFAKNEYGEFSGDTLMLETGSGEVIFDKINIETSYTSAKLTSSVGNGGDETVRILERGFYLSSETLSDSIIPCGEGPGSFSKTIENLDAETRYFVRVYVINDWGTEYGVDTSFRTMKDVPTVMTGVIDESNDVKNGSANIRAVIESHGRESVESIGFCWSTTNPVPKLETDNDLPLLLMESGGFSGQLTGLKGGTVYYIRAYAKNKTGLAYADNVERFVTPSIFDKNLAPFPANEPGRLANSTAYFTIDDNLYLLGGDLGAEYTDKLWMYSVSKNKWEPRMAFSGGPAKWQAAVSYGLGAYVYGGYDNSGDEKAGLYYYDNAGDENRWLPSIANPDSITVCRSVGYSYSNSVFFVGGMSGDTVRKEVWSFQHGIQEWRRMADFPVEQYGGVAVLIDNVVYVGMGKNASGVCNGNLWTTSDAGQTWNTESIQCTIYNKGILAGVAYNKNIYVIDEDYYILEYNTQTGVWSKKSQLPDGYRGVHCMSVINNKIYIGLGNSANALVAYDPIWDPSSD